LAGTSILVGLLVITVVFGLFGVSDIAGGAEADRLIPLALTGMTPAELTRRIRLANGSFAGCLPSEEPEQHAAAAPDSVWYSPSREGEA
jgi:hypothetical protein